MCKRKRLIAPKLFPVLREKMLDVAMVFCYVQRKDWSITQIRFGVLRSTPEHTQSGMFITDSRYATIIHSDSIEKNVSMYALCS